jgi:2-polyprenyl-3-methyl-5-hydroxy-6-metoxy-1,4-benzoquinol methylase
VIEGYAVAAPEPIDRFNAVSSSELFKPLIDLLPLSRVRVIDIGAGPGRDAAWLASMGHTILAVEPVKKFRDGGMAAHLLSNVDWIDDRLPDLVETKRRGQFDLVVPSAVWQHLDDRQRLVAVRSLAEVTTPAGLVIMPLVTGRAPRKNRSPGRSERGGRRGVERRVHVVETGGDSVGSPGQ